LRASVRHTGGRFRVSEFDNLYRDPLESRHVSRDDLSHDPTGNALFHLLASLFSVQVSSASACRKDIPVDEIRQLRADGCSVAEIARRTGTTVAEVRRIVGKLDPAEKARRREEQEGTAARIDAGPGSWSDKVQQWEDATGQSGATFWRVLHRPRRTAADGRPMT
jgi:DNA-directed RNA polymerase specialized sigma24 family protein